MLKRLSGGQELGELVNIGEHCTQHVRECLKLKETLSQQCTYSLKQALELLCIQGLYLLFWFHVVVDNCLCPRQKKCSDSPLVSRVGQLLSSCVSSGRVQPVFSRSFRCFTNLLTFITALDSDSNSLKSSCSSSDKSVSLPIPYF